MSFESSNESKFKNLNADSEEGGKKEEVTFEEVICRMEISWNRELNSDMKWRIVKYFVKKI